MATLEVSIINKKVIPNNVNDDLVNEKIRFKEVMVIDANGDKLGIKMRREALEIAYRQELDLLCVAPKGQPPVCKVLDTAVIVLNSRKKRRKPKRNSMLQKSSRFVCPRLSTSMTLIQKCVMHANGLRTA